MTEQHNSQPADSSVNLIPVAHYGQNVDRLAQEAHDFIVDYRPQIPLTEWTVLRPFVLEAAQSVPFLNLNNTKLQMRALTRLARWARNIAGLPLDPDILLDPDTINEACHNYPNHDVARLDQWALLRAAEERGQPHSMRSLSDRNRDASPLTTAELAETSTHIATFTQARDIRSANMAMGLSGGAGLRFNELLLAKTSDIVRDADGWTVTVRGKAPRTIAVLDSWTLYLDRALAVDTADDWAICTGVNHPTARLKHFNNRRRNRRYPDCLRLRSTWMAQVCTRLTVGDLVYAAGYTSAASLRGFDPWLLRKPDELLLPALRSSTTAVTR